ncbi:sigma-70 family RNA polymerase sigma factor [Chitinophaga lutea]|uniref:Sigma-70 family RNA polymerase sigma factor n=1 Tax=Chitinophaga lutea TaxID=2488634 RepID=A0A3N4PLP1_9BACT|nr:sigma-70 family RNA polymerase sigma factor [Chitinophaga lutea]RPE08468.1 sigma-70 family RNA polymerase sigma factor [Chitinophaga lutea]
MHESEFLQLIDRHQGIIYKICRLYRDSKEDREDLFQEIVYQLWKSLPGFSGQAAFTTWMYRVALTTAIAAYRKKQPRIVYPEVLPEQSAGPPDNLGPEVLMLALKRLNDGEKALIALYLEDLSYREIAEITGISENNVGVKLNRIKQKIAKLWIH